MLPGFASSKSHYIHHLDPRYNRYLVGTPYACGRCLPSHWSVPELTDTLWMLSYRADRCTSHGGTDLRALTKTRIHALATHLALRRTRSDGPGEREIDEVSGSSTFVRTQCSQACPGPAKCVQGSCERVPGMVGPAVLLIDSNGSNILLSQWQLGQLGHAVHRAQASLKALTGPIELLCGCKLVLSALASVLSSAAGTAGRTTSQRSQIVQHVASAPAARKLLCMRPPRITSTLSRDVGKRRHRSHALT